METPTKGTDHRANREAVSASIVPIAAGLCCLYLALVVLHPIFLSGERRWLMAALALVSSLAAAGIGLAWRRAPRPETARRPMALFAAIVLTNSTVHFALYPVAGNTTNFIAFVLGLGLVLLSRRWFLIFLAATFLSWGVVVFAAPVPDVEDWGWFLFFSSFVALVLQEQRIHVTSATARREAILREHAAVLQSLMQDREASGAESRPVLQRLCLEAQRQLNVNRTSVWLLTGDKRRLRLAAEAPSAAGPTRESEIALAEGEIAELLSSRTIARSVAEARRRDATGGETGRGARLEVAILGQGKVVGVVVHESRAGDRAWTLEDRAFAGSIADYAALALQTQERATLERRARESERLESLGVLAGGVAHDFNNLLTVILGNASLIERGFAQGTRERRQAQAIQEAGERARELAQQMLAYAGRARTTTQTVDLAALARDLDRTWAHDLLGNIRVEIDAPEDVLCAVDVDPTQIRQVLLNLVTNARDAQASTLKIRTEQQTISAEEALALGIEPGRYHQLTIEDDGQGMDSVTRGRIFDPFFTTRKSGSGLGLAAVLGILRSHRGTVRVYSKRGQGSRFELLLPASSRRPEPQRTTQLGAGREAAGNRVLVVEDQDLVAETARSMLEGTGRIVLTLSGCTAVNENVAALDLGRLEVALVDLTLADGSGVEVIELLRGDRPDLPVVLMSGYDARNAMATLRNSEAVEFLPKPFNAQSLTTAIDAAKGRMAQ